MSLQDAANEVDVAITRNDMKSLAYENVFAGVSSFLRRRLTKDLTGVDLAVTGIPFDQAVTNRPGTRLGPRAIREASLLQAGEPPNGWGGFSPLEEFAIVDYGDMALDYANMADTPRRIEEHVAGILKAGAACVSLGGDHSVTLPLLRAHAAAHGPLSLIQVDAHTDTWPDDDPGRVDHGTFLHTAMSEGLIVPERSVQIGIRSYNEDTGGIQCLDARFVHEHGAAETARRVREIVGDNKVYFTFDIDGLDPAYAPGTGTPVWGGLTSGQAAILLRDLAGINLVGADVVEVSPPFDHASITAVAAAHVAQELIALWGWPRRAAASG